MGVILSGCRNINIKPHATIYFASCRDHAMVIFDNSLADVGLINRQVLDIRCNCLVIAINCVNRL